MIKSLNVRALFLTALLGISSLCITQPSARGTDPIPVIQHGIDICSTNVGLAGVGVSIEDLQPVSGGLRAKASKLANGIDPRTGWPLLYRLNITGMVNIDVPCVISQCRISKTGVFYDADGNSDGFYTITNRRGLDFVLEDCDIDGPVGPDNSVVNAVVYGVSVMQRCLVTGGNDGVWICWTDGCLIEDSFIYNQHLIGTAHSDGIQMAVGTGAPDTYVIHRCRIGQPNDLNPQNSAIIIKSDQGDVSGVTISDCYLAGGNWTVYTRLNSSTTYTFTGLKITNCLWHNKSWKYGAYSTDIKPDVWMNNSIGTVSDFSNDYPIDVLTQVKF